jgi:hypothetical protein
MNAITPAKKLAYCTAQKQVGESAADNGILGVVFAPSEPGYCDSERLEKGDRERVGIHESGSGHGEISLRGSQSEKVTEEPGSR